jgi:hypothetical protein
MQIAARYLSQFAASAELSSRRAGQLCRAPNFLWLLKNLVYPSGIEPARVQILDFIESKNAGTFRLAGSRSVGIGKNGGIQHAIELTMRFAMRNAARYDPAMRMKLAARYASANFRFGRRAYPSPSLQIA